MKIAILSDIHFEFHQDGGESFIKSLDPTKIDVLVLAGDISTSGYTCEALNKLCALFPHVVFCAGNHDYYGLTPQKFQQDMAKTEKKLPNLHWLRRDNDAIIDGVQFIGDTLWFPRPPAKLTYTKPYLADFQHIRMFEPWVYQEHRATVDYLTREMSKADVVVTHHLPSRHCIMPLYKDSVLNQYFCYDMTEEIESLKPPLWVFGHTHSPMDLQVGSSRLICNAFGYPYEPKAAFRDRLVLDVFPR